MYLKFNIQFIKKHSQYSKFVEDVETIENKGKITIGKKKM